jgi:hypothetical protein
MLFREIETKKTFIKIVFKSFKKKLKNNTHIMFKKWHLCFKIEQIFIMRVTLRISLKRRIFASFLLFVSFVVKNEIFKI